MIFKIIITIIFLHSVHALSSQQIIAVQNTNQNYFAYLPLINNCDYNQVNISQGNYRITPINYITTFQALVNVANAAFWAPIYAGYSILLSSNQLLQNGTYNQVVPYASAIATNAKNRSVILLTITTNDTLQLSYSTLQYIALNNTVKVSTQSEVTYSFNSLDIRLIIKTCLKSNLKIISLNITTFLGVCLNTSNLFIWDNIQTQQTFLSHFVILNITANSDNYIANYTPINNHSIFSQWNAAILTSQNTTLFCNFAINNNFTCLNFTIQQKNITQLISRLWGAEVLFQQDEASLILNKFSQNTQIYIPGDVVSVFQNVFGTVFIESTISQSQLSYLNVFNSIGRQYANFSYTGSVLYYGKNVIVIQDSLSNYYLYEIIMPVFEINSSINSNVNVLESNTSVNISCLNDVEIIIQYDIIWTSLSYPSTGTYLLPQNNPNNTSNNNFTSYQNIYTYNIDDIYLVIGPAFNVFLNSNPNITTTLLDTSVIQVTSFIVDILDVVFQKNTLRYFQNKHIQSLLFTTEQGNVDMLHLQSHETTTIKHHPCSLNSSFKGQKLQNSYLFFTDKQYCECELTLQQSCQELTQNQAITAIYSQQASMQATQSLLSKILGSTSTSLQLPTLDVFIKTQLLDLIHLNMLITIFSNNSVVVTNITSGGSLGVVEMNCKGKNETEGLIFQRDFYDDLLILYCCNSTELIQYTFRLDTIVFSRVVPLYGFVTRRAGGKFLKGQNYVYLQVFLSPTYNPTLPLVLINLKYCCVLRMDLTAYTVSVIAEIIFAESVLAVESVFGIDIAYYNQTTVTSTPSFLKIYFSGSEISFNQTSTCNSAISNCSITPYIYQIAFSSFLYNFASMYSSSIIFNITKGLLYQNYTTNDGEFNNNATKKLSLTKDSSNPPYTKYQYYGQYPFSFGDICGPITQYSIWDQSTTANTISFVEINDIVTKNKIFGNLSLRYYQIIDLADILPNNTLSSLLMIVSDQDLSFYLKFNGTWLANISTIQLPQNNCQYFLYSSSNQTSATFATDCAAPNINPQTPLLTVVYQNDKFTYSNSSNFTLLIPMRNIISILNSANTTYVFGLIQGPSNSVTGRLYYMLDNEYQALYISSKVTFLVDYDVIAYSNEMIVAGLDPEHLSIWLNLPAPHKHSAVILPNYTYSYSQFVNSEQCSKISIVSSNDSSTTLLLSCFYSYFQLNINYSSINNPISVLNIYRKYTNCQPLDKFKNIFLADQNNQIYLMIATCQQNINTVRLQQYQSINSSGVNIVTSYLQIYTLNGPMCSSHNIYEPIRIISISTTNIFMLFNLYEYQQQIKLIYEKINGVFYDTFIELQPSFAYSMSPLGKQVNFPIQLILSLHNDYSQLNFTISASPALTPLEFKYVLAISIIFVVFNCITVLFVICWCVFGRIKNNNSNNFAYKDALYQFYQNSNQEIDQFQMGSHLQKLRTDGKNKGDQIQIAENIIHKEISIPSNAPSFSVVAPNKTIKRKVSQIQLFQPRVREKSIFSGIQEEKL